MNSSCYDVDTNTVSPPVTSDCEDIDGPYRTVTRIPSITTITSEVTCTGPRHGKVERHDFTRHAIPPNSKEDILILTSGMVRESGQMLFQRTVRREMWFIYISITIIYILFIISTLSGINSTWYNNLRKSQVNPYVVGILWAFATVSAYGAIFMIWEHVMPDEVTIDFTLSIYFLIGAFLSLLWTIVLFHGDNIALAVWAAAIMFLYHFWLFSYIWTIRFMASLFMIPIVILYGYILYSMVHLATLNNIII